MPNTSTPVASAATLMEAGKIGTKGIGLWARFTNWLSSKFTKKTEIKQIEAPKEQLEIETDSSKNREGLSHIKLEEQDIIPITIYKKQKNNEQKEDKQRF